MKKLIMLTLLATILVISGCIETRYITEKYIKNQVENHKESEFSTLKTYSIFKGTTNSDNAYLELTGIKYLDKKEMVIGADKYYMARKKFKNDKTIIANISYVRLSLDQCKAIILNFELLKRKIKAEKLKRNEEVYHDYSVSDDLFISFHKSKGSSSTSYIDFWVKGEKYTVSTNKILKKLRKFIKY